MSGWIKSLGKDSLVYGVGYGVTRFLQIIILPIIARSLSLSEFGYYSNYVIFYTFAGGLFIFGLDSAVTRFFFDSESKKYHRQLLSSAFFFITGLSLFAVTFFFIFSSELLSLLGIPLLYKSSLIYVLLCITPVAINGFLLTWFKWKRERIKFLLNSGCSVVFLLIPLLLISKVEFIHIFQILFWSQLAIALMSGFMARDYLRPHFNGKVMLALLSYGFPWMLVYLFGASRTYLDRMFLTRYLNDDIYGIYNFSVRIASLLSLVITAFDMSFGPLAYSIWNKEGAREFFGRLQTIYVFMISVLATAICIFSPVIIQLLGGLKYAGAERILPILLFAAIPLSLINFSNLGAAYAKKSIISTITLFIGLSVVLLLNFVLTARYLQYGATTASLVGHLAIIISGYYFSNKYYKIPFSYLKDGLIFLLFLSLSILSVNYSTTDDVYFDILFKAIVLTLITIFSIFLLFKKEFKEAMVKIGMR